VSCRRRIRTEFLSYLWIGMVSVQTVYWQLKIVATMYEHDVLLPIVALTVMAPHIFSD